MKVRLAAWGRGLGDRAQEAAAVSMSAIRRPQTQVEGGGSREALTLRSPGLEGELYGAMIWRDCCAQLESIEASSHSGEGGR